MKRPQNLPLPRHTGRWWHRVLMVLTLTFVIFTFLFLLYHFVTYNRIFDTRQTNSSTAYHYRTPVFGFVLLQLYFSRLCVWYFSHHIPSHRLVYILLYCSSGNLWRYQSHNQKQYIRGQGIQCPKNKKANAYRMYWQLASCYQLIACFVKEYI
jgi:hypothetical protein